MMPKRAMKRTCHVLLAQDYDNCEVAFSLPDLIRKIRPIHKSPLTWAISVHYVDGKDGQLDTDLVSRATLSRKAAREILIEIGRGNARLHRNPNSLLLGPRYYDGDKTMEEWDRLAAGKVTEDEITDFINRSDNRVWLSSAKRLTEIEKEWIASRKVLVT